MAISFAQTNGTTGSGTTVALSFTGSLTNSALVVVGVGAGDGGDTLTAVDDDIANSYSEAVSFTQGAAIHTAIWYAQSANSTNPTVTAHFSASAFASNICIAAYEGAATSAPTDQTNTGGAFAATVTTGSITPTEDGELIVACATVSQPGIDWTPLDADFTDERYDSGGNRSFNYIDRIQTTAAGIAATMQYSGSNGNIAAVIASFKAAAGPPPPEWGPRGGAKLSGRRPSAFAPGLAR